VTVKTGKFVSVFYSRRMLSQFYVKTLLSIFTLNSSSENYGIECIPSNCYPNSNKERVFSIILQNKAQAKEISVDMRNYFIQYILFSVLFIHEKSKDFPLNCP